MTRSLAFIAVLCVGVAVTPAMAADKLSFRDLEFDQPRDPLVGSNVVFADVHHSPAGQIELARDAVNAAIPAGTSLADAKAILRAAGARCSDAGTCVYRDVQTIDENIDDVAWTVQLHADGDKVAGLDLDRAWQRH
jgi:hypothetical protein